MTIFFAADHHFQHANVLNFTNAKGDKIRPEFSDIQNHDNFIISKHNHVVKPDDLVYFLGDVTWKTNLIAKEILQALNGRKRLVAGNHDDVDWLMSTGEFERVYLWKYFPEHNLIASHVPLAESDLKHAKYNVHGHIHEKVITKEIAFDRTPDLEQLTIGKESITDTRYYNAGMERNDYTPISLETLLTKFSSN